MNKIVIEFCAEDRQRLDDLCGAITLLSSVLGSSLPTESRAAVVASASEPELPADVNPPFDPPAPAPDPVAAAPAPAPVSLGEFQKAIVTRCAESAATKQKVQALVHKYADSVSNIPEDKRSEVLAALSQI